MKQTGITNKPAKPLRTPSTAITAQPPPAAPALATQPQDRGRPARRKQAHFLWRMLELAASLRITVVLFALSLILVFYGTWAQVDQGVWTAVAKYFRSALVWIPLHVVLLRTIDPVEFYVPFPGGWLLGGVLLTNLLAAHIVRFKLSWKRSGILLIHAGIIIMMLGEFIAGVFQVEGRMIIGRNQTVNYVQMDRDAELAIITKSTEPGKDDLVSVPHSRLQKGGFISDKELPFDIEVHQYMVNSVMIKAEKGADNPATTGAGLALLVQPRAEVSGTATSQVIDMPSAYVTFRDKKTNEPLGTYLVSFHLMSDPPQVVEVDGKPYDIEFRPKRSYRDFRIKLVEFRYDKYPGTRIPKNYQSDILLTDPDGGERERPVTISMNNPLRHKGETFYQASFTQDEAGNPTGGTVLQVVRNPGWLMPYIACIVVTLGMLIHFGINLLSFLKRRMAQ